MNTLTFHDTNITIIDRDGQTWLSGPDIGAALGYEDPAASIRQVYKRYQPEFGPEMSQRIKLLRPNNLIIDTRLFSPRGALLLAMHSNTPRAAAFRAWVLDILEGKQPLPGQVDPVAALQGALLAAQPRLKKHMRYARMGLRPREIAKLLNLSASTIQRDATLIRHAGLDKAHAGGRELAVRA